MLLRRRRRPSGVGYTYIRAGYYYQSSPHPSVEYLGTYMVEPRKLISKTFCAYTSIPQSGAYYNKYQPTCLCALTTIFPARRFMIMQNHPTTPPPLWFCARLDILASAHQAHGHGGGLCMPAGVVMVPHYPPRGLPELTRRGLVIHRF